MTKISFVFLIVALLLCSDISDIQTGMCQQTDQHNLVKVFSHHGNEARDNKPMPLCRICKSVIKKVIEIVGKHISKDEAGQKLNQICEKLKIPGCKSFVQKYRAKLIDALSVGDHSYKPHYVSEVMFMIRDTICLQQLDGFKN